MVDYIWLQLPCDMIDLFWLDKILLNLAKENISVEDSISCQAHDSYIQLKY